MIPPMIEARMNARIAEYSNNRPTTSARILTIEVSMPNACDSPSTKLPPAWLKVLNKPLRRSTMKRMTDPSALVAERMERGDDGLWLRFYLNPKAVFADGRPITAEDVRYTFELLMREGSLGYRTQFANVADVQVEGPRQVRFNFKNAESRTLPLDLATLPVLPEHWWKTRDFANGGGFEAPLGSGP